MKTSITFHAAILALAAGGSSCATLGSGSAGSSRVYLVGVAGGG